MKRFILKVMEHGLIIALIIGSTAITSMGFLNPGSWRGMAFLALGGFGFLLIGGMVWVKRKLLTVPDQMPESGSDR